MGMQGEVGMTHKQSGPERTPIPALDVPPVMSNPCAHEDDMNSWLQYPLEDSFDRNYCSELIFGELVNPHVHLVKDEYIHQSIRESENSHMFNIEGMGCEQARLQQLTNMVSMSCTRAGFKSDAALAMGAGRAAGLLLQTGSEAFNGVRIHAHPSAILKTLSPSATEPSSVQMDVVGDQTTSQVQWQNGRSDDKRSAFDNTDPMMTLLDMKKTSVLPPAVTPSMSPGFNFSLFSRPVTTALDNLRFVGAASGPTNVNRVKPCLAKTSPPLCEPSIGDSNCSVVMSVPYSQQSTEFSSQDRVERDGSGCALSGCLPTSLPCRPDVCIHNETEEFDSQATCFSGSAVSVSENALGTIDTTETTVSPSRLSGSSAEKIVMETFTATPKKSSFSTALSEDVDDVTTNAKKPPPGPRVTKRTRAAETHNESEKKRRNKINVRLKALQSLLPNSNKTDKASVLDEAIEYTKMLQAQVQFMTMRTGMYVPMHPGMHFVPLQQMPAFSHMRMGIDMGLGMGVDMSVGMMMDINAVPGGISAGGGADAGAGTSNLSPSRKEQAVSTLPQTISAPRIQDVSGCLPTSSCDPYQTLLAQKQPQPMLMNVQTNADMYSALLQQRQPHENHISNTTQ
eukprot:c22329_g1_i2 orf=397-2268(+)